MSTPRPFRFGVQVNGAPSSAAWRDLVRRIEDHGYSTMFVSDHYLDRNLPAAAVMSVAPISAMAAAAMVTSTVRIGCRVFCIDYHVPAALAKEAATIDLLSDGRLELGIGAGWSAGEYDAMGLEFDPPGRRVSRLEEVVAMFKAHFSGEVMQSPGPQVTVHGYAGLPLSVQRPHPPLMIGGSKQRVLSLAAREADIVSLANVAFVAHNEAGLTPMGEAARRVGYVREAAGDRFGQLDIENSPYFAAITSDRAGALERIAKMMKCEVSVIDDHPNVLVGDAQQVEDTLVRRREELGINYVTVQESLLDAFAPIAARLAGT